MINKKILHVGESISGGGAGVVLRNIVTILKEKDIENTHYLLVKDNKEKSLLVDFVFEEHSREVNSLSQIFSLNNLARLNDILKQVRPDIIHLQNYGNLSSSIFFSLYRYKRKNSKLKIIHTAHTFEYVCSHHAAFDYKKNIRCSDCSKNVYKFKIFTRKCSRLGFLHSWGKGITSLITSFFTSRGLIDHWTTPSTFLKKKMLENPLIEQVTVLRNPLLKLDMKVPNSKISNDKFEFLYFGRFSSEKNIDCIIKAFQIIYRKHPGFKLTLIGKGDQEPKLKSMVEEFNIKDRVQFIPFLSKPNLERRMKSCNVSIISSKCYENAPMAVIESIQANLIPIACNHGGMKEMISVSGIGLLFNDGDFTQLSTKMEEAYIDYNDQIKKINIKKDKVLDIFGANECLIQLKQLYSRI